MNKILNWFFGSFFRTLGRLLVFILLGYLLFNLIDVSSIKLPNLFTILDVSADVKIAGTTLNPSSWSYIAGNRNVTIIYEDDVLYPTIVDIPKYFAITICSDTSKIQSWYTSPLSTGAQEATDVSIYKTNIPCNYPNSDYTGGRILYITGTNGYSSSVNGTNATIYNSITYYQPNDTSVVLLGANMTNEPIAVDYATDTLISQNQSVIEQNQQIINGQQSIINNQNSNSQAEINNANANTDKTIDSQKVCNYIDKNNIKEDNKILYVYDPNNVTINDNNNFGITDYINITSSEIEVLTLRTGYAGLCFYNSNKEQISCMPNSSLILGKMTIPTNANYVRFSIQKIDNKPTFNICTNGNQAIGDNLNDINNNLTNDSINEQGATDFVNGLDREYSSLTPFSDFINLPLRWIQSLFSSQNSCEPISLPLPYLNNKNLILPCMTDFWQRMGSLGTLIQMVWIAIVGVRIFNGLFLLTCETLDPNPDKDMTKLRTWEL